MQLNLNGINCSISWQLHVLGVMYCTKLQQSFGIWPTFANPLRSQLRLGTSLSTSGATQQSTGSVVAEQKDLILSLDFVDL